MSAEPSAILATIWCGRLRTCPTLRKDSLGMPDFAFLLTDTLLIFDNVAQKIKVVANAYVESTKERDVRDAYRSCDRTDRKDDRALETAGASNPARNAAGSRSPSRRI